MVNFMKMSELQDKDIINIKDGKNIGRIVDLEVSESGSINYIIAEPTKFLKFNSFTKPTNFSSNQIVRIGKDVILVDLD